MKILIVTSCCLVTAGCTNAPNALQMTLAAGKASFALDEPIYIVATLTARDGNVCLGKTPRFDLTVRRIDSSKSVKSPPPFICGTGFAISLPMYPVLATIALLDVADAMDRYTVLSPGEQRSHRFQVHLSEPLLAGRYHLQATLAGTRDVRFTMNFYPDPLFWKIYDQPVVAEVDFVVDNAAPDQDGGG